MSENKTCSQCGEALPTDAVARTCSACQQRAGLSPSDSSSRDDRVNDVILLYLQAVERGEAVDREKFLAEHAEIAEELKSFFGNHAQFQQVAEAVTLPPVASIEQPSFDPDKTTLVAATPSIPSVGEVVRYFGDYELLLEIARGGMGVVYKAWQVSLKRDVALKMILTGQLAGPQDVQRFYTEAEAAAQLDHPGIVPVFEVGQHEGQHFFSMGFVDGRSLAARVAEGPLPAREAAELVRDVALAVQYAHDKGVIHRDLKPGNILLDKDGRPRVTDFGLAKLTKSGSDLTGTGQILGTPSYMPPEQASGKTDQIGPAADVYALGAVLYCLLVGRPPFQAANQMDTLLQVLEQEPIPPRQLNPNIPLDLETICLKCLEKSSAKRYASSQALAEDLRCFVEGEPITARPVTRRERVWKWARKRPAVAGLLVLTPLALLTAVGLVVSQSYTAALTDSNKKLKVARDDAEGDRKQAVDLKDQTARALAEVEHYRSNNLVSLARRTLRDGDLTETQNLLGQVSDELRNWECRFLSQFACIPHESYKNHNGLVSSVAFSRDGKRFASGSWDKTIHVHDRNPWCEQFFILAGHSTPVTCVAFSPDGIHMAASSADGTIKIWNIETKKALFNGGVAIPAQEVLTLQYQAADDHCLTYSPEGRLLACGVRGGRNITLWDPMTRNQIRVLAGLPADMNSMAFSPDGMRLAVAAGALVRIWDTMSWEQTCSFTQHGQTVRSLAFHPNGKQIISASGSDGARHSEYRIWDWDTAAEVTGPQILPGPCSCMALTADGKRLAFGGTDGTVWVRDTETFALLGRLRAFTSRITELAFHPDGQRLAVPSGDRTKWGEIGIWTLKLEKQTRSIGRFTGGVGSVAFGPDSDRIAGTSTVKEDGQPCDGKVRFWDLDSGREFPAISTNTEIETVTAVSPDFQTVATMNPDREICLWSTATKDRLAAWRGHTSSPLIAASFSPDGRLLATAARSEGSVRLWDLAARKPAGGVSISQSECTAITFDPSGKRLLIAGTSTEDTPFARVVNVASGQIDLELSRVNGVISCLAWSPSDNFLAAGGPDGNLRVWKAGTGGVPGIFQGHTGWIRGVAFSPDGQRLASCDSRGSVRLWDPEFGFEVLDLLDGDCGVNSVAWSPDGRKVAAGTIDGDILMWESPSHRGINLSLDPVFLSPFK